MSDANLITTQLRESASYLVDQGWHQTAELVIAAADEIESLRAMLKKAGLPTEPAKLANENEGAVRGKGSRRRSAG
jgi:hypothetical protein